MLYHATVSKLAPMVREFLKDGDQIHTHTNGQMLVHGQYGYKA